MHLIEPLWRQETETEREREREIKPPIQKHLPPRVVRAVRGCTNEVADDGQCGCEGEGRREQSDVTELHHHLKIIIK